MIKSQKVEVEVAARQRGLATGNQPTLARVTLSLIHPTKGSADLLKGLQL